MIKELKLIPNAQPDIALLIKSYEIQSLADAINFAIEKGLELADINPY